MAQCDIHVPEQALGQQTLDGLAALCESIRAALAAKEGGREVEFYLLVRVAANERARLSVASLRDAARLYVEGGPLARFLAVLYPRTFSRKLLREIWPEIDRAAVQEQFQLEAA